LGYSRSFGSWLFGKTNVVFFFLSQVLNHELCCCIFKKIIDLQNIFYCNFKLQGLKFELKWFVMINCFMMLMSSKQTWKKELYVIDVKIMSLIPT
jgi:hypothetical protein